MADHAVLSASGSHRWLNCTPSARLELEFENTGSEAAREGTAAHALCEHKLKRALHMRSKRPISVYDSDEMEECTDAYVDFVMEQYEAAKQICKDPLIFIEQRLDFSCYVPDGFGTGDCLVISDDKLHIIDFKYGIGVLVEAEDNPQMKLYALGALAVYDALYDIKEASMTIFQPRRENVSTWTIPVSELKAWAETELKQRAKMAYDGEGEYLPGEWCTFCRAAVRCRARAEEKLTLAQKEFRMPPLLTDAEIEDILAVLPDLTKWANDITAYALDTAFAEARKYYHVTTDLGKIPALDTLADSELEGLFEQNDARQLIHITYGLILTVKEADGSYRFRDRLFKLWRAHDEEYAQRLEKHIGRHLELLYSGFAG